MVQESASGTTWLAERRGRPDFSRGAKMQITPVAAQLWHEEEFGGIIQRIFRWWQYSHAPRTLGWDAMRYQDAVDRESQSA
jgi:hypothetical protein